MLLMKLFFPYLFKVAPCFHVESLISCHFHILVGIFPQNALGLHEQASWMHTHLVFSLSFHTLIALSASFAWKSLLLTLSSINGHLHSPLISLVDVTLYPFCLLHTTSTIIFYSTHSAMSMVHAHVLRESWKGLRTSKVWNNCLACHRGCAWFEYFVWWRWSIARPYDFVGITFFGHVILKRHDRFIGMHEVLLS